MTEKRYFVTHSGGCCLCGSISRELEDGSFEELSYDDIVNRLNNLDEENKRLKEQIKLIANAHTYTKQESVKEILRHEIWGIDSVAGESADAFHDYCVLSKFFKEHYSEDWDNFE